MNVILIVKIAKSALLGYVLRRALKETDTVTRNSLTGTKLQQHSHKNSCFSLDSKIDHKVFDELYAVEDTQNEYKNNSNFSNEFEGLEYLINSGN